jgi:hypothetical protein
MVLEPRNSGWCVEIWKRVLGALLPGFLSIWFLSKILTSFQCFVELNLVWHWFQLLVTWKVTKRGYLWKANHTLVTLKLLHGWLSPIIQSIWEAELEEIQLEASLDEKKEQDLISKNKPVMMVQTCNPNYMGGLSRRITVC